MGKHRERLRRVWHRVLPDFPLPLRVAPGIWWLARNDAVSDDLFAGIFERGERRVFAALLKPGMAVLRGAEAFFREVRPVLLCEIEDARIAPWGYNGREIIDLVAGWGYDWSRVDAKDGRLQPLVPGTTEFMGNFLARPR